MKQSSRLDIYLLELEAAISGVVDWMSKRKDCHVFVVTDNAGVACALLNHISTNAVANGMLSSDRGQRALSAIVDVILVISAENPSGCCSRVSSVGFREAHVDFDVRCTRVDECVAAHGKGWHWASMKRQECWFF